MSSKRKLYKPATQDSAAYKDKRRPLVQGRLDTKTAPEGATSKVITSQSISDHDLRTTIGHSPMLRSPQHNLTSLLVSDVSTREEALLSPRRATPSVSEHQSPKPAQPSRSLDVSDTDSDLLFSPRFSQRHGKQSKKLSPPDVLVVDASHQTKDPNQSEVDIQLGFEHTPVKVVCHSPAAVHSNLRDTGNVDVAKKVAVDQVPSVSILTGTERGRGHGHQDKISRHKSPMVVHESTVAGRSFDSYSHGKPAIAKGLFPFDGDVSEGSPRETSSQYDQLRVAMKTHQLDLSGSSVEGSDKFGESGEFLVSKDSSKSSLSEAPRTGKKKKGTRIIPSRYMQATKGPMKATDRTIVDKCQSKLRASRSGHESGLLIPKKSDSGLLGAKKTGASTSGLLPSKKTAGGGSGKKLVTTLPPKRSSSGTRQGGLRPKMTAGSRINASGFSTTPEARGVGGIASTPTGEETSFRGPIAGDVDVSAIQPLHHTTHHSSGASFFSTPESTMNVTDTSRKNGISGARSKAAHHTSHRKEEASQELSQLQLDMMYTRYLQYVFLHSKAKKCFQEQEKQAMSQIYGLWEETERLNHRKADLELELGKLKHINKLDSALDLQETGLNAVAPKLSKLKQQSNTLAAALDTTQHHIQTRGIYIPDDEDVYQEALLSALRESEQLLGEISVMSRVETPKIASFAESINVMERTVASEVKELIRCQELVSAAQSLCIQEWSLRAQDIEAQ